ncbi:hypothetical protein B0H16DRAFT_1542834 [Mycena metata]|uniref:Uncharacterized protein n=1 Tax=Mycena metata TaxID=1033252 RepID=A0AAD7J0Z7_9AGAR|nr:hypothetical protein B0H16DRAFT_1542834 [Mycena metata]
MAKIPKVYPSFNTYLSFTIYLAEDEGVEGCGVFCRRVEGNRWRHMLGNTARLFCALLTAPILLLTPLFLTNAFESYMHSSAIVENSDRIVTTPDPLVAHAPGGGTGKYDTTQTDIDAERGQTLHLCPILQPTENAGGSDSDLAIHALMVEAIRHDEAGGCPDHEFLGPAPNSLLPRRARPVDLGKGRWRDLAWLLDLNQASYDPTRLAAVCSLSDSEDGGVEWLGIPIAPRTMNEPCTPLAIAFPVFSTSDVPLAIHRSEMVHFATLRRDPNGLYTNKEMQGVKDLTWGLAIISLAVVALLGRTERYTASIILYIVIALLYRLVELLAGTIYLVRSGWVFLEDEVEARLGKLDPTLHTLDSWGEQQFSPRWQPPQHRPYFAAKVVDLRRRVSVDVIVVSRPTSMVLLALHGPGITAMLITPHVDPNQRRIGAARKAGMCNLPLYIREEAVESDSIYIGA